MAVVDEEYRKMVDYVLRNGIRKESSNATYANGEPAYTISVPSYYVEFDGTEALYPTTKRFFGKTAISEIQWIWAERSNNLSRLRELNGTPKTVWDEWEIKEGKWKGTIGPAYGYQIGQTDYEWNFKDLVLHQITGNPYYANKAEIRERMKAFMRLDQLDNLVQLLLTDPDSRRMLVHLFNIKDFDMMSLPPCVWATKWTVHGNALCLKVTIRSNDLAAGNPFNFFQYQMLRDFIAKIVGLEPGSISFDIGDLHIYGRHLEDLKRQVFESPVQKDPMRVIIDPSVKTMKDFSKSAFTFENVPQGRELFKYDIAISTNLK